MRKNAYIIMAALGLLLVAAVSSARAQSAAIEGRANIPFAFTVSDQSFPAGTYTVERISQNISNCLRLRSADNSASVIFLTLPAKRTNESKQPRLVFNVYGDEYFLTQVWSGRDGTAYQLHKCRRQRTLVRSMRSRAPAQPQRAEVALRQQ
jgi:hypothetical protein